MSQSIHKKILSVLHRAEKRRFFSAVLLEVLVAGMDLAFLAGLLFLVNQYLPGGASVYGNGLLKEHPLAVFGIFCAAYALKNAFAWWVLRRQQEYFYSVATRLSENRLRRYLQSGYDAYVHVDSSVYSRQIGQQPVEYAHYVLKGWHQVIGQSLLVLLTVLAILFYDASLFLMLFAMLSLPVLLTAVWLRRRLSKTREAIRQSSETSLQHLQESLAGFIESKIFSKKEFFTRRYAHHQQELNHHLAGLQSIQALPSRLVELFALAGFLVLLGFSVYRNSGALDLLTLGAFLAAAYKIIPGMVKLLNGLGQVRAYEFVLKDLEGLPDEEAVEEKEKANGQEKDKSPHIETVVFEQVSFCYGDKTIFHDLSFSAGRGELVGISGVSGKGKTTLVHLLLRFLKPAGGFIRINGRPVDEWPEEAIWERVSYVRQQPFFLHDSVYQNVVMGEEGVNEDRFSQAVDTTGFYTFTADTSKLVRENGRNISGGQRQRIALARALYKDADLLLLDEPFSELDAASVRKILNELKALAAAGKIILLITHDAETLKHCSKIIHLENC